MTQRLRRPTNFNSPMLNVVWASLEALEPDDLLELEVELRRRLALGDLPSTREKSRIADALSALRAAAEHLGESPSVRAYEELRQQRRELELPPSSSIRTRLAGGWNECLRRAQLRPVPDGDLPVASGFAFDEAVAIGALQECARDLGGTPTTLTYRAWAGRPDVRARPGRRPLTEAAFKRLFGSWDSALRVAGLAAAAARRRNGRIDPTEWSYPDDEILAALRLVHSRLGYSPSVAEYDQTRRLIRQDWEAAEGELRTLPATTTIMHRWGVWSHALAAAGLPPRRPRKGSKPGPKQPHYSDAQVLEALQRAYREVGEPFTGNAYKAWRERQRLERADGSCELPSAWLAATRFRGWTGAVARALAIDTNL